MTPNSDTWEWFLTRDEQARQRLVEIALQEIEGWAEFSRFERVDEMPYYYRKLAGFRDPSKGHWCAAGLTAAMAQAGLLVPAPGTPARRGAIALLDWVFDGHSSWGARSFTGTSAALSALGVAKPGDIIAWKQNPEPEEWRQYGNVLHAFAVSTSKSMCDLKRRENGSLAIPDGQTKKCSACVWETSKGHVALIVKVDDISLTTLGWGEGQHPGRVMMRRLWRDEHKRCTGPCEGSGYLRADHGGAGARCPACKGRGEVPPSSTVLARKQGLLYGIARPVAA